MISVLFTTLKNQHQQQNNILYCYDYSLTCCLQGQQVKAVDTATGVAVTPAEFQPDKGPPDHE